MKRFLKSSNYQNSTKKGGENLNRKTLSVIFSILPLTLGLATAWSIAVIQTTISFGNSATVKTVGIDAYWDSDLLNPVQQVDWGMIEPGKSSTTNFYLYNPSNVPVSVVFNSSNWIPPEAEPFMDLTWNITGPIPKETAEPVSMTLAVSALIQNITDFSFDITIWAEG